MAVFSSGVALTKTERRAWAGGVTPTSFSVFSDVEEAKSTVLKVSKTIDMKAPVYTSTVMTPTETDGSDAVYYSVLADVTGLDANTEYWWQFYQGSKALGVARRVVTAPAAGTATSFSYVEVACSNVNTTTVDDIFPAIIEENPAFVLHTGDIVYDNIDTDDIKAKRDVFIRQALGGASFSSMFIKAPVIYMPDNHDIYSAQVGLEHTDYAKVTENARQVYRETVPHYPFEQDRLGVDDDDISKVILSQQWDWGRVRFIMPDLNSQRDHTGSPNKILGDIYWNQKQALLDQLDAADADEDIKIIHLISTEVWISKDPSDENDTGTLDAWDESFPEDQNAIVDKIESLDTLVVVDCGDGHQGIADDGTNGCKGTNGTARIASFMSSGLYQTWKDWGVGPGSWNGSSGDVKWQTLGEPIRLYMVKSFVDNGGSDLTFKAIFKSNPVSATTKVPTTKLTVSSDDVTPEVEFSAVTASGAASATIDLGLTKSWFGPVDGCDVAWSSSDGQSGMVHVKPNTSVAKIAWEAPATAGGYTVTLSDPTRCDLGGVTTCTVTVS